MGARRTPGGVRLGQQVPGEPGRTQRDDDLGPVHVAAQRPFFDIASGVAGAAQIHRAQLGATVETYLSLCGDVLEVGEKLELHHRRSAATGNPSPHLPGIGFEAGGAQCSFEAGRVAGPGVHLQVDLDIRCRSSPRG